MHDDDEDEHGKLSPTTETLASPVANGLQLRIACILPLPRPPARLASFDHFALPSLHPPVFLLRLSKATHHIRDPIRVTRLSYTKGR